MANTTKLNKRVAVIVSYKSQGEVSRICMPRKMLWDNKEIVFKELGLRHPTTKGERMIHVFDMSDGANDYRLEFDSERLTWTLLEVLEGCYRPAGTTRQAKGKFNEGGGV